MKHLERIILGFAIILAAMSLAACSSDSDNDSDDDLFVTCPAGTVVDMACLLHYDDATAKWFAYPMGTDTPFSIGGYCDGVEIVVQNASKFLSTHDDVTAIVSGFFTFTSSEPTEWSTLYRYTLTISTLTPYNDWCGTKE